MEKKLKNFIVNGNLKDKVTFKFLPNELAHGNWWFRIVSLCYSINGPGIQSSCSITTNLSTSLQYSNNLTINYEQPFALIMFEPKVKRKVVNFNEQWLKINVYSEEMVLSIISLEINEKLSIDCDIFALLQIIQK